MRHYCYIQIYEKKGHAELFEAMLVKLVHDFPKGMKIEDIQEIVEHIKVDTEERKKRDEENEGEEAAKVAKIKEKMSMEDAAKYIQRRWAWFQTEGKFLAKKGKKGRKGKKKKKK